MNIPIPAPDGAGFQYLGMPGEVAVPLPRDLLASAPWVFVVYLAFQQQWPPVAIITLVAVLLPIAVPGGRLLAARFVTRLLASRR